MNTSTSIGFIGLAFCGLLLAPLNAAYADPVLNISNHPVTNLKKLSMDDIRKGIIQGGLRYKWVFEDQGPGKLKASQFEGRFSAVISITYSETAYSITLLESMGLDQKGNQIRSRYNRWVELLTRNIDAQLQAAAL